MKINFSHKKTKTQEKFDFLAFFNKMFPLLKILFIKGYLSFFFRLSRKQSQKKTDKIF
jgi:hypothetical protein